MSIGAWIVLGLNAVLIAFHFVNRRREGLLLDVLLSVIGAAAIVAYVFRLGRRHVLKSVRRL